MFNCTNFPSIAIALLISIGCLGKYFKTDFSLIHVLSMYYVPDTLLDTQLMMTVKHIFKFYLFLVNAI